MNHKAHDPYDDQPYYSHWASALFSVIVFVGELATIVHQSQLVFVSLREANAVSVTFLTSFQALLSWLFSCERLSLVLSCLIKFSVTVSRILQWSSPF